MVFRVMFFKLCPLRANVRTFFYSVVTISQVRKTQHGTYLLTDSMKQNVLQARKLNKHSLLASGVNASDGLSDLAPGLFVPLDCKRVSAMHCGVCVCVSLQDMIHTLKRTPSMPRGPS